METLNTTLVSLAALGTALNGGLFFIFSNTVMNSLFGMPAPQGIAAMQRINRDILNPTFFILFMGTALLSLAVVSLQLATGSASALSLAGSIAYLVGVMAVTVTVNVPLNDALEAAPADSAQAAQVWNRFQNRWQPFNHVRTVACLAAAVLLGLDLML